MMQHVLQALDDQIGFITQKFELARDGLDGAQKHIDELETENRSLRLRVQGLEANEKVLLGSITSLKAQLAAVPATMSRAEWDAWMDAIHDGKKYAGPLDEVGHELC